MGGILLLSGSAPAQIEDGQHAKDKPGLALVKPQAWSKDDQATGLEFLSYTDRSGYYEFRTEKIPNYQVPTSRLVKLLLYPESPQSLSNAEQRAALQKTLEEFVALSAKFPSAARYLDKAASPLKADAAKYDAGSVKESGQWVSRSNFYRQKATALMNLLRTELMAAPKIREFDLSANQYFLGLQELAKAEPSVGSTLDGARALYDSLVRKEDRLALLGQLNSPSLAYDQAMDLVGQLKTLRPEEDARANLYIKSWDSAVAAAGQLTKQILDVRGQFESSMEGPDDSPRAPVVTPDLAASLDKMNDAVKQFRAGSPPPVIQVPLPLADAMIACADNFPLLAKKVQAREYLDAKAILDPLSTRANQIGPKTAAALNALQKRLGADIEKFRVLRDEAKMLAENDKIEAALSKYEQAYAIIPTKEIAAQIELLKKQ